MADVFVSYARSDKPRVAPLVAAIEAQGWSVWWDPAITPGQEFDQQIEVELKAAAAVLVVWTPSSVSSRWVRGEAREGADRGILVPVRFEGAELPIDVRALHTTDLDGMSQEERDRHVQQMLRALGTIITRSRSSRTAGAGLAPAPAPALTGSYPTRVTICVLPFTNMSGDPGQDYFSDGLTEDIITELSRWRRLFSVRSRSASFRYRGSALDMKQVARDLDVRFIVEGSVRRVGDRIRINAQLIEAESGSHVWAERFDHGLDEIFAVQDRVVQTIVSTLVGRVQASDAERARRKPPASLAAYECVLQGNALAWDEPQGAAEATKLFEKAIEIDPGYAIAHALLAALRYARWKDDPTDSTTLLDEAYALARRAVELDDGDSTCHSMLGQVQLLRRSFDEAVQYARRGIEINPNNQWNAADLGCILIYTGRSEEALSWFARAREIDPYFDPAWYWRALGQAHMHLQHYAEAAANFNHSRVRPYRMLALLAACQAELGDTDRARVNVADCLSLRPNFSIAQYMRKEPFQIKADADRVEASLRRAGLPE
jgi:TolB-like protein